MPCTRWVLGFAFETFEVASKLPGYHPDALYKMGERHICAKYNRLVCPQLGDHSRRSRKTSYGASECTQGEEVEEGECGEPAIGLEYRAVEKFHDKCFKEVKAKLSRRESERRGHKDEKLAAWD